MESRQFPEEGPRSLTAAIDSANQDWFDFASLARSIANSIKGLDTSSNIVIGLEGPWGQGKTSLANLVVEALGSEAEVVEFNPWWREDHGSLVMQFFSALSVHIRTKADGDLELATGLAALGLLLAATGEPTAQLLSLTSKHVAKSIRKKVSNQSLDDVRKGIIDGLRRRERLVIVIDDLDRLLEEDARAMLKLIGGVADFPNVTFILGFDAPHLKQLLQEGPDCEYSFVDKIVDIPLLVPGQDGKTLWTRFADKWDVEAKCDEYGEHEKAVVHHLEHLLSTPRDVTRLLETLNFVHPNIKGEINPIDLVALELLRLKQPRLHRLTHDHSSMFLAKGPLFSMEHEAYARWHQENWLNQLPDSQRDSWVRLLQQLFPVTENISREIHIAHFEEFAYSAKRVASPALHRWFYWYSGYDNVLSASTFKLGLASLTKAAKFREFVTGLLDEKLPNGDRAIDAFFARLNDVHVEDIDAPVAEALLAVTMEHAPELLSDDSAPDYVSSNVARFCRALWARIARENRVTTLLGNISSEASLNLAIDLAWRAGREHSLWDEDSGESQPKPSARLLDADAAREVLARLSERLETMEVENLVRLPSSIRALRIMRTIRGVEFIHEHLDEAQLRLANEVHLAAAFVGRISSRQGSHLYFDEDHYLDWRGSKVGAQVLVRIQKTRSKNPLLPELREAIANGPRSF